MRVEVFELPLVALHGLEHQLHHLLTVARAPLVWEETAAFIFTGKHSVTGEADTQARQPNLWASLEVCGTTPWPFLHWGTKDGKGVKVQDRLSGLSLRFSDIQRNSPL